MRCVSVRGIIVNSLRYRWRMRMWCSSWESFLMWRLCDVWVVASSSWASSLACLMWQMGSVDNPSGLRYIAAAFGFFCYHGVFSARSYYAFLLFSENYSEGWLQMSCVMTNLVQLPVCSNSERNTCSDG